MGSSDPLLDSSNRNQCPAHRPQENILSAPSLFKKPMPGKVVYEYITDLAYPLSWLDGRGQFGGMASL